MSDLPQLGWEDAEYLLQKAYFSERSLSAALLNRENALNGSVLARANRMPVEAVESHKTYFKLARQLADLATTDEQVSLTAQQLDNATDDLVLCLAKCRQLPGLNASQLRSYSRSNAELEAKANALIGQLVADVVSRRVFIIAKHGNCRAVNWAHWVRRSRSAWRIAFSPPSMRSRPAGLGARRWQTCLTWRSQSAIPIYPGSTRRPPPTATPS